MLFMRGHHPVPKTADHGGHDHEEDHDQAVRGGEYVIGVGVVEELHSRVHQLEPHPY
jgi:hypothetical protein